MPGGEEPPLLPRNREGWSVSVEDLLRAVRLRARLSALGRAGLAAVLRAGLPAVLGRSGRRSGRLLDLVRRQLLGLGDVLLLRVAQLLLVGVRRRNELQVSLGADHARAVAEQV